MADPDHSTIDRGQARTASFLSSLAVLLLVSLSGYHLWESFSVRHEGTQQLQRLLATILFTQALCCGLLSFPILSDCFHAGPIQRISLQTARIAGVVLTVTGLGLVLTALLSSTMYLVAVGAIILTSSCISLMALF